MTTAPSAPRAPVEMQLPEVRFIGEQDGAVEGTLKAQLSGYFSKEGSVQRAYLVRISSGNRLGVALCIKTAQGDHVNLVRGIGEIFSSLFVPQEHLDILFLEADQESTLKTVCAPFFERAGPPANSGRVVEAAMSSIRRMSLLKRARRILRSAVTRPM